MMYCIRSAIVHANKTIDRIVSVLLNHPYREILYLRTMCSREGYFILGHSFFYERFSSPRSIVIVFGFGPFSGRRNTYRHAYILYRLHIFAVYLRL